MPCDQTLLVKELPAYFCPLDMGGQLLALLGLLQQVLLVADVLERFERVTLNDKLK